MGWEVNSIRKRSGKRILWVSGYSLALSHAPPFFNLNLPDKPVVGLRKISDQTTPVLLDL
jgi:hypothetical protein